MVKSLIEVFLGVELSWCLYQGVTGKRRAEEADAVMMS
jgi:hypothetical protein